MNDDFLGNEFRVELQNTLVARAHELDSAERSFRDFMFNDIMRGVGSKYFPSPGAVRASIGFLNVRLNW